jgi:hypothetical protein
MRAMSAIFGLVDASHREGNCREIAERLLRCCLDRYCNFLKNLVAGAGFEPATFGL